MATSYSGKIEGFTPIAISETKVRLDYTCIPSLPDDVHVDAYYKKSDATIYSKIESIDQKSNIITGLEAGTSYDFYLNIEGSDYPTYSGEVTTRDSFKLNDEGGLWDVKGRYVFSYSNSSWTVSFVPDADFILDDETKYKYITNYSSEQKEFAYGPQRYYCDATVPPMGLDEPESAEDNYNNTFINFTPISLEAGNIPSVTFDLYNKDYLTDKTLTLTGEVIQPSGATSEVRSTSTWKKPFVESINSFVIGEEIVISVYNPNNRTFDIEIYGDNGSLIGSGKGYNGTEVSGFNSPDDRNNQRDSLDGKSGGEYYVRLIYGTYTFDSDKNNYWYSSEAINPPKFTTDNISYYDSDNGNKKHIVSTITYDDQIIVQGQSYLVINLTPAKAVGGSENKIVRYIAVFNKVEKIHEVVDGETSITIEFGNVSASHSQYVYVTAVDLYNQATTATKRVVIRPYTDPYVDMKAFRVDEESDISYFRVVPHRSSVTVNNKSFRGDVNELPFSVKYAYVLKGTSLDEIKKKELTKDVEFKKIDSTNFSRYILNRLDYTKQWTYVVKVEDAFHQDFRLAGESNNAIYSTLNLQNKVYKKEVVVDENSRILEKIKRNINDNFICPKFRISVLYPDETINYEIPSEDIKTGGSYNENYQNGQRRTLNFELYNEEGKYTPNINKFWAGTRLRLDVGVEYDTDEYYWFEKGIFVITSVQPSTTPGLKTVKVNAGDKYALFENNTGKLISAYEIDIDNDIEELIHEILFANSGNGYPLDGKDFIYHSSFKGAKTQVKISKSAGDSYSSILSDIATQLSAEMFYDDHGRLNVMPLEEVTQDISKELLYNYDTGESGISSLDFNIDYTSIVNRIIVTASPSSGGVYYAESLNDDAASPLCYQRIGYRTGDVINDSNIWSDELAKERADYELRKVLVLKSTTSITVPFNPFLKVNNVISLSDDFYNLKRDRFLLQSVSFNLDYSNQMSISFSNLNNLPFVVR